jgi:hypothetical protein
VQNAKLTIKTVGQFAMTKKLYHTTAQMSMKTWVPPRFNIRAILYLLQKNKRIIMKNAKKLLTNGS